MSMQIAHLTPPATALQLNARREFATELGSSHQHVSDLQGNGMTTSPHVASCHFCGNLPSDGQLLQLMRYALSSPLVGSFSF